MGAYCQTYLKTYCNAKVIKIAHHLSGDRQIGQGSQTETPGTKPTYTNLIINETGLKAQG